MARGAQPRVSYGQHMRHWRSDDDGPFSFSKRMPYETMADLSESNGMMFKVGGAAVTVESSATSYPHFFVATISSILPFVLILSLRIVRVITNLNPPRRWDIEYRQSRDSGSGYVERLTLKTPHDCTSNRILNCNVGIGY